MDVHTAQKRIHAWGSASPTFEDKLAVDTLFAELTRLRQVEIAFDQISGDYAGAVGYEWAQ